MLGLTGVIEIDTSGGGAGGEGVSTPQPAKTIVRRKKREPAVTRCRTLSLIGDPPFLWVPNTLFY
jgi:hypothetical protein